jgi:transposase
MSSDILGIMWHPSKLTSEQKEERRLAAARLLQAGQQSQTEIARQMGVRRQTVSRWALQLSEGGEEALRQRVKPGRKPRLETQQWQQVLDILRQGAKAAGFPTERWTLARIQSVISLQFGIHYNAHYLSERLHRLGWSVQEPAAQARERSDLLVEAWLKGDWSRIKKSLSDRSADCLYR